MEVGEPHLALVTMPEPVAQFADELLHRLAYNPETCPPELRISGNWGADGHGGPGHQDESTDACGTQLGRVCFRGCFVHVGKAIYRVDRYDRRTEQWTAHWPD